ncbi:MAG: guanylate kinase, partial [Mesorhizobium sp.]
LEWAEVHGNCYATPREPAEIALAEGRDMLFDIDWQGAQQLKEKMRADIVSIFILPPSMKELKARLKRRAEDQESVIETRLKNARLEIEHWKEYDFVIVN